MASALGRNELWRRMALMFGIIVGLALFCYVAPAMISVTAMDWAQEQADEVKPRGGIVSQEDKRLHQLPLQDYIQARTGGRLIAVDERLWQTWMGQVQEASLAPTGPSPLSRRISEEDRDTFWTPSGPVAVFFQPDEIPWQHWGLRPLDGDQVYISAPVAGQTVHLALKYQDYSSSVTAMSQPYRTAPKWLYHPYRNIGIGVMAVGLLLYIFLPRRRKSEQDIAYTTSSMLAGDLAAVILLLPFYGLPFLINGGTRQALTGLWPITLFMWLLAILCLIMLYYNAWYASYHIQLTSEGVQEISFRGIKESRFQDMTGVNIVSLRNPGWFRKLMLGSAFLALMGGRTSTQPAGSALLAATAAYGGLEICTQDARPGYIWFTDQKGGIIINNFERVPAAIQAAGVQINEQPREIEGFSVFM